MRIAIGNLLEEVVSVDFKDRCIAIEDRKGLVWINSEFVTLKHTPMSELKHTLDITPPADKRLGKKSGQKPRMPYLSRDRRFQGRKRS